MSAASARRRPTALALGAPGGLLSTATPSSLMLRSPLSATFAKTPITALLQSPRNFFFGLKARTPIFPETGLPNEILFNIVSFLYTVPRELGGYDDLDYEERAERKASRQDILSCLYVNRQFYAVAKYILTSEPEFSAARSFNEFLASFRSNLQPIQIRTNAQIALTPSTLVRRLAFTPCTIEGSTPPAHRTAAARNYLPYLITDGTLLLLSSVFPKLTHVSLKHCRNLTDSSVITFVSLFGHRLQVLDLEGCSKLTDDTLKAIGQNCSTRMKKLSLRNCTGFTEKGLDAILKHCTQITDIDLSFCHGISSDGLTKFLRCVSLQEKEVRRSNILSLHIGGHVVQDLPSLLKLYVPKDKRREPVLLQLEISLTEAWGIDEDTGVSTLIPSLPTSLRSLIMHEECNDRPTSAEIPEVIVDGALTALDYEELARQCRSLSQLHILNPSSITDEQVAAILGTNIDMIDLVLKNSRAITLRGCLDAVTGSACAARIRRLDISSASIAYRRPKAKVFRPRSLTSEPPSPLPLNPLTVDEMREFLQRKCDDGYVFENLLHLAVPSIGAGEDGGIRPNAWTPEAFTEIGRWCEDLRSLELRLIKHVVPPEFQLENELPTEPVDDAILLGEVESTASPATIPQSRRPSSAPQDDVVRVVGIKMIRSLMKAVEGMTAWSV